MEDEMKDYYSQNPTVLQIQSPKVGQLVAVPAEEDAWLRAQIVSTEGRRIKASAMYFCGGDGVRIGSWNIWFIYISFLRWFLMRHSKNYSV